MRVLTAAILAAALAVAATGAEAQPRTKSRAQPAPTPPPPVVQPVTPAAPVEPLGAAIPAYAAFQNDITDLQSMNVNTADDLERVLDRAAAQNDAALTRGWIAYGAMTAAQSRDFVQGVRETAGAYGNAAFIRGLTLDPGYAQVLKGGREAARLALESSHSDGLRIYAVGERYREMGYALQRQRWASQVAPQQPARVTRMKTLAAGAMGRQTPPEFAPRLQAPAGTLSPAADPTTFGGRGFWDSLRLTPPSTPVGITPVPMLRTNSNRPDVVNRMTTLAAIYILGATMDPAAQADRLLDEGSTRRCFSMAQSQFYGCMSAARFRYENAFCLGEHGLKEMGACVRDASSIETPVAVVTPPPAPEPAPPAPAPAPNRRKKK